MVQISIHNVAVAVVTAWHKDFAIRTKLTARATAAIAAAATATTARSNARSNVVLDTSNVAKVHGRRRRSWRHYFPCLVPRKTEMRVSAHEGQRSLSQDTGTSSDAKMRFNFTLTIATGFIVEEQWIDVFVCADNRGHSARCDQHVIDPILSLLHS